ncbi:pre-rRNA processing and 40S ribosomal subunit assembly [Bulinus truncatus]|nr:pre-rRNA processing and 40S ribosomal subunit assembly [Bulinus truncatus]
MAESRDQVLIDFQAVTGIEDFDLCTNILTQHDWNLEQAVNSIMGFGPSDGGGFTPDEIGPSPAEENMDESTASLNTAGMMEKLGVHLRPSDHGASDMASGPSYSSSPLNFSSRMIHFTVEYRDKNINVVLADTECVGQIKDVLEDELGIPRDKQELKGLVKRKRIIDDSTILKDLNLPKENTLYLLTPQISNPTVNKAQSQEGEGTSQGLEGAREYLLKVTYRYDSKYRNFSLKFDCQKTVRDVKQSLSTLTDVPVRHQVWTGWPKPVQDQDKLFSCGLNYPSHDLEMSKSESLEVSKSESSAVPKVLQEVEEMEADTDEDDDTCLDSIDDDDLFTQEESLPRRIEPLIPDGINNEKAALEHFTKEFANRYGTCHPHFFIGSLDDAIQESLVVKATKRKLLAVYLHHDSSIFSNVFCSQLLCDEAIVNYLSVHMVTWAWDLTSQENTAKFLQVATRHFGSVAATQMRSYSTDQLPSLLLISRSKATNEVIDVIQGHVTLDEMMIRLMHAVEVFQGQREADINEEKERESRERIKQEQDAAYMESLAADRKKAEAQKVEDDKRREEQERLIAEQEKYFKEKEEAERLKEAISKSIATTVPEEPPEGCSQRACCLRFRVPHGEVITRRFLTENNLGDLLNFLTSKGFHTEDYKVITTFPRRDISALDTSCTLETLNLYPQETLILEERKDFLEKFLHGKNVNPFELFDTVLKRKTVEQLIQVAQIFGDSFVFE